MNIEREMYGIAEAKNRRIKFPSEGTGQNCMEI